MYWALPAEETEASLRKKGGEQCDSLKL